MGTNGKEILFKPMKNTSTANVIREWSRSLTRIVKSPSLELFKTWLGTVWATCPPWPCFEQGISTRPSPDVSSSPCCEQKLPDQEWPVCSVCCYQADALCLRKGGMSQTQHAQMTCKIVSIKHIYIYKTFHSAEYSSVCPLAIAIQPWVLLPNISVCSIIYKGPLQSQVKFLCCFLLILANRDSVPNLALFSAGGKPGL